MSSVRHFAVEHHLHHFSQLLQILFGIGGEYGAGAVESDVTSDSGEASSRLLQYGERRRMVPGRQAYLEVELAGAFGHEGQLQSGRTNPADVVDLRIQNPADLEAGLGQFLSVAAIRRAHQRILERTIGNMDWNPVLEGSMAQYGAVQRVGERIEDESRVLPRILEERDGYSAHGDSAGEVRCPVDGIDDPDPFRIRQ